MSNSFYKQADLGTRTPQSGAEKAKESHSLLCALPQDSRIYGTSSLEKQV